MVLIIDYHYNLMLNWSFISSLSWSKTTPEERSSYLNRIADLLESRLDDFARAESLDQGKPVTVAATIDIPRAIHNFRFFANSILYQTNSSVSQERTGTLNYVHRAPVGVAGLISPVSKTFPFLSFPILNLSFLFCSFSGTFLCTC